MKVIAVKGLKVSKENKPREYITDALIVDVPKSAYYMRRIADKDLIEKSEAEFTAQQDAIATAKAGEIAAKAAADKAAAKAAAKPKTEGAAS